MTTCLPQRTVPYAAHRFGELARLPARKPADILASFERFYFDTALSSCPAALPGLKSFANEDDQLWQCADSVSASRRGATHQRGNRQHQITFSLKRTRKENFNGLRYCW